MAKQRNSKRASSARQVASSRRHALQRLQRRLLMSTVLILGAVTLVWWAGGEDGRAVRWLEDWQGRSQAMTALDGRRVGIVAGHMGFDTGAVCPDGVTEGGTVREIADRVVGRLERLGAQVDLLAEYDQRLNGYQADALVSLHADSCLDRSGFKIARSTTSFIPEVEDHLLGCMRREYGANTNMDFDSFTITEDMTSYHAFQRVAPQTPAIILEMGFLGGDARVLVRNPERAARGVVNGIVCFFEEAE